MWHASLIAMHHTNKRNKDDNNIIIWHYSELSTKPDTGSSASTATRGACQFERNWKRREEGMGPHI